jgi:imidazolonepropionase-like amidohydrolase
MSSGSLLLTLDFSERPPLEQMRDESAVERIVRATTHARNALMAGYTTYRDLGTEALGSADAHFRDCINRGIIPGPRLFVATEAIASSGGYQMRIETRDNSGVLVPRASDVGDGPYGVRQAVRRRVADGADIIKVYADYRRQAMRFPDPGSIKFSPADPSPATLLFTQEEMEAIVDEARRANLPVAAHATTDEAALQAIRAGVTSIEHLFLGASDEVLNEMKQHDCIWVPTLATAENMASEDAFKQLLERVRRAHQLGVRIAAGGDTGTFNHGLNAREMELLVVAGIPVAQVMAAGTIGGWEACGGDNCGFRFGVIESGARADIIGLDADPRIDPKAFRKVSFVMKDGRVWKYMGRPVGMDTSPPWPIQEHQVDNDTSDENEEEPVPDIDSDWTMLQAPSPVQNDDEVLPIPKPVWMGSA